MTTTATTAVGTQPVNTADQADSRQGVNDVNDVNDGKDVNGVPAQTSGSPVWVPVVRIIVGVCIILAGLWWSWQRFATLGHGEYVYTMFGYMLVMMLGGGLLANSVISIFKQVRDNITADGDAPARHAATGDDTAMQDGSR